MYAYVHGQQVKLASNDHKALLKERMKWTQDGAQYPVNIFSLWKREELASLGFMPVRTTPRPDDRLSYVDPIYEIKSDHVLQIWTLSGKSTEQLTAIHTQDINIAAEKLRRTGVEYLSPVDDETYVISTDFESVETLLMFYQYGSENSKLPDAWPGYWLDQNNRECPCETWKAFKALAEYVIEHRLNIFLESRKSKKYVNETADLDTLLTLAIEEAAANWKVKPTVKTKN